MWTAALTVRTSANTLLVMRQLALPLSNQTRVGMADVPDHVAAEEHVLGAVELGSGGFPAAFGVRPAAPLDEIVFDQGVLGSHAADTFDAAVADGVAADDLRLPRPAA